MNQSQRIVIALAGTIDLIGVWVTGESFGTSGVMATFYEVPMSARPGQAHF